jgi:ribosome hibernation promoting factor
MQIQISARQVEVPEAMRSHVESRLAGAVEKYFASPIEAHVTVAREGLIYRTDCSVHVGHGIHAQSHGQAEDLAASFDSAAARLEKQLRRYKRRLRDHHSRQKERRVEPQLAQDYVLAPEPEDHEASGNFEPVVIAERSTAILTLTVGEAVMRMDLADLPLLMFRNSAHGGYNVVYRRDDGHIGWLDPSVADGRD